ncbi:MAG: aminotransferase class V-fold PLP-dependent enzyme, partial [Verrucomicrobia bacterium]|nr:aminotransferase class V-fold PLP-dependent enzyme [Verrucomicrobiota bacterium]
MDIPRDYHVLFTSSATECWEIIAQSVIDKESYHFFNGAFGRKWFEYTQRIFPGANPLEFDLENELDPNLLPNRPDLICLTQNETSNGTQVRYSTIVELRNSFPESLLALDATSSMAGIRLPFSAGDIWYASVQKCFGLPSGMAVLICSPRSVERIKAKGENQHYNSLDFILQNADKMQTSYTPNVLGIYLLQEVMKSRKKMRVVSDTTERRMSSWVELIKDHSLFDLLVTNEAVRSSTVLAVKASPEAITDFHVKTRASGFVLGQGYGDLKSTTFRV